MRILLVEENPFIREAFRDILEAHGYEVHGAENGPEALALLGREPGSIDLVISELVMPDMNALQLYEALHAVQEGVKMLVVTRYPIPNKGRTLAKRPGVSWIGKPIGVQEFGETVRHLVGV